MMSEADGSGGMKYVHEKNCWVFSDPSSKRVFAFDEQSGKWLDEDGKVVGECEASSRTRDSEGANVPKFDGANYVYVDPISRKRLIWDVAQQRWINDAENTGEDDEESELSSSENEDNDASELKFQLLQEKREKKRRKPSAGSAEGSASSTHKATREDPDGTVYDWDPVQKAYVPRVDEDFLARYQASYGNYEDSAVESEEKKLSETTPDTTKASTSAEVEPLPSDPKEAKKVLRKRLRAAEQKTDWFNVEDAHNRNVYITNLPADITLEELETLMSKCGIIERDFQTNKLKLKLYMDDNGFPKGDARCCYIKVESVELALQILDGYDVRGKKINVERAQFQLKGNFDPSKRKKMSSKLKKKLKAKQDRLFEWRPDKIRGERPKSDSTVILKNLFSVDELLKDASLLFDLQGLLEAECCKYGEIKKIMVYDNNPEGVGSVTFREPTQADDCITMMDFRVLRGRQVRAERWDGRTKYMVEETEEQKRKRQEAFEKSLEVDDDDEVNGIKN